MLHEVFLPKTGIYMDDVQLLEWLVDEGASVQQGDLLFRMETNKVELDVEAEASGLLHRGAEVGNDYPIGTVIGWIAEDEVAYSQLVDSGEAG